MKLVWGPCMALFLPLLLLFLEVAVVVVVVGWRCR